MENSQIEKSWPQSGKQQRRAEGVRCIKSEKSNAWRKNISVPEETVKKITQTKQFKMQNKKRENAVRFRTNKTKKKNKNCKMTQKEVKFNATAATATGSASRD